MGSGGGLAALAAAQAIGADGTLVGADISEPLVEFARRRAATQGVTNASFVVVDVQHADLPAPAFDVVMSQFGVMFFDEPVTAFTNIARHVGAGGRIGFACWQPIAVNPWHIANVVGPFLPAAAPPPPGKRPTGPFSLGDAAATTELLASTGWHDIGRVPHSMVVVVARDAIVDDGQLAFMGVPDDRLADAATAVEEHLAQFARDDGRYDLPVAFQIFTGPGPEPGPYSAG